MGSSQGERAEEAEAAREVAGDAAETVVAVEQAAAAPEETPAPKENGAQAAEEPRTQEEPATLKEPCTEGEPEARVADSEASDVPKAQVKLCAKVITDATDEPINVASVVKKLEYEDNPCTDSGVADKLGVLDAGKKIVEAGKDALGPLTDEQPSKKQKIAPEVGAPASDPVA